MIITSLQGGLGNQMFQYAIGRCLAEKYKTNLVLDITKFKNDPKRNYALDEFKINARIAEWREVRLFNETNKYKRTLIKIKNFLLGKYIKKIQENSLRYNPKILKGGGDVYLSGYWQSEKYFTGISSLLRREFIYKKKLSKIGEEYKERIIFENNAVSLHVRRGDYVTDKNANAYHGVCKIEYYENAVKYLCERLGNLKIFIFSDDLSWVKNNLKLDAEMILVDLPIQERDEGQKELYLMSLCKYHIIANSTFSWWGAWLGKNNNKIVVAPSKWFQTEKLECSDIVPNEWIKM